MHIGHMIGLGILIAGISIWIALFQVYGLIGGGIMLATFYYIIKKNQKKESDEK